MFVFSQGQHFALVCCVRVWRNNVPFRLLSSSSSKCRSSTCSLFKFDGEFYTVQFRNTVVS